MSAYPNPRPAVGNTVVTDRELHHPSGQIIPANTMGYVCGRASGHHMLQVEFGPTYGTKYVDENAVRVLDVGDVPLDLGEELVDMAFKLSEALAKAMARIHELEGINDKLRHQLGNTRSTVWADGPIGDSSWAEVGWSRGPDRKDSAGRVVCWQWWRTVARNGDGSR
jgi:hypothetical protein